MFGDEEFPSAGKNLIGTCGNFTQRIGKGHSSPAFESKWGFFQDGNLRFVSGFPRGKNGNRRFGKSVCGDKQSETREKAYNREKTISRSGENILASEWLGRELSKRVGDHGRLPTRTFHKIRAVSRWAG